jgi:hypothetical protein
MLQALAILESQEYIGKMGTDLSLLSAIQVALLFKAVKAEWINSK